MPKLADDYDNLADRALECAARHLTSALSPNPNKVTRLGLTASEVWRNWPQSGLLAWPPISAPQIHDTVTVVVPHGEASELFFDGPRQSGGRAVKPYCIRILASIREISLERQLQA